MLICNHGASSTDTTSFSSFVALDLQAPTLGFLFSLVALELLQELFITDTSGLYHTVW